MPKENLNPNNQEISGAYIEKEGSKVSILHHLWHQKKVVAKRLTAQLFIIIHV
jgi:hypothetical protein